MTPELREVIKEIRAVPPLELNLPVQKLA